jgi:hypothetical protein
MDTGEGDSGDAPTGTVYYATNHKECNIATKLCCIA